MLIGIDPRLGPDLLAALRAMGHGDEIALVDANFPAAALARRLVRAEGVDLLGMLTAVLTVLPMDASTSPAVHRMTPGRNEALTIHEEIARVLRDASYRGEIGDLGREAFYDRAREAFVVVATGERRLFGNVILAKGAIAPAVDPA